MLLVSLNSFKTLTEMLAKEFFLQQSSRLSQSPLSEADPGTLSTVVNKVLCNNSSGL